MRERDQLSDHSAALGVPCPVCQAPAGSSCRTMLSGEVCGPHQGRQQVDRLDVLAHYVCETCGLIGPMSDFQGVCAPGWTHGRLIKVNLDSPVLLTARGAVDILRRVLSGGIIRDEAEDGTPLLLDLSTTPPYQVVRLDHLLGGQ